MNKKLKRLLQFSEFTNKFADIKRKTILNKDGTAENNAQHSFQLALTAWYISETEKLDLEINLLIKYALVHDLIETYSGTFPAYDRTTSKQKVKDLQEEKSFKKILKENREFNGLLEILKNYLKREDEESRFIYALDKLIPIINIELNNNDFYYKTKTTYEQMLKVKVKKISTDPTIEKYFRLLAKYLKDDKKFFWPDNKKRDYSSTDYQFE